MTTRKLTEEDMRNTLTPVYCVDCSSLLRLGDTVHTLFPEVLGMSRCKQCTEKYNTSANTRIHS